METHALVARMAEKRQQVKLVDTEEKCHKIFQDRTPEIIAGVRVVLGAVTSVAANPASAVDEAARKHGRGTTLQRHSARSDRMTNTKPTISLRITASNDGLSIGEQCGASTLWTHKDQRLQCSSEPDDAAARPRRVKRIEQLPGHWLSFHPCSISESVPYGWVSDPMCSFSRSAKSSISPRVTPNLRSWSDIICMPSRLPIEA
jgi:hypothetical protein